jgi:CBS domain containing-hemolysin-like protein
MRELQAETGWPLEWQPRETVSTWALRLFGHVPKRDESTVTGDYKLTVFEANAERPRRVRVERVAGESASPVS